MSNPYDLIFDSSSFNAQVVFVGTRCDQDNLLHNYRTGAIHFVKSGSADVLLPGAPPLRIAQPSLVFFPHAHRHWLQGVDGNGLELVCATTSFSDRFNEAVALSLPEVIVLPLAQLSSIEHTLQAFFAEAASQSPGSRQLADRLCEVLLGFLMRHAMEQGHMKAGLLAAAGDRRIALALKAIHTQFCEALDLDALANRAGMSRTRFVERFKALVGTSPHQYLVGYRMDVAQQLLAAKVPVKAVAARVGYATASAFVRSFKEVVGVPPGAWAR
ncbi:AraC family transcriptional regulator [Polaromonas sp.]|uniref:AraC family transcriptional regulator n=1 Tax=Polaromonas sp. TaxID=1869339 RepID=UPI0032643A95